MWCFVSLPDSVITEFKLTEKARGQLLLDQVCQRLGILEVDYFGLQFTGAKGETLWLNTRNRIDRQVSGNAPYRLNFRVKFFVQPHQLLQDSSRHLYFLQLKKHFCDGRIIAPEATKARLYALIAQATFGDHNGSQSICNYCKSADAEGRERWTSDSVALEHGKLSGVKPPKAEYQFLKELAQLDNYGTEFHTAKNSIGSSLNIGVSSEELRIYDSEFNFIESISYNGLKMATHDGKSLYLTLMAVEGDSILELKLHTQGSACALYRSITEYHAFYRCETVRNAVKSQFTRDFKETFFSFFNEEESDKKYIFDVKRTSKEAYDHCRRILYNQGRDPIHMLPSMLDQEGSVQQGNETTATADGELEEKGHKAEYDLRCKICMDAEISTVFCPCGHMVSCELCAEQLEACPMCRSKITNVQKAFLPI